MGGELEIAGSDSSGTQTLNLLVEKVIDDSDHTAILFKREVTSVEQSRVRTL
jgi:hypothetical protein